MPADNRASVSLLDAVSRVRIQSTCQSASIALPILQLHWFLSEHAAEEVDLSTPGPYSPAVTSSSSPHRPITILNLVFEILSRHQASSSFLFLILTIRLVVLITR